MNRVGMPRRRACEPGTEMGGNAEGSSAPFPVLPRLQRRPVRDSVLKRSNHEAVCSRRTVPAPLNLLQSALRVVGVMTEQRARSQDGEGNEGARALGFPSQSEIPNHPVDFISWQAGQLNKRT